MAWVIREAILTFSYQCVWLRLQRLLSATVHHQRQIKTDHTHPRIKGD
jgi:hypothetical protein